jgi:hypothetical protein
VICVLELPSRMGNFQAARATAAAAAAASLVLDHRCQGAASSSAHGRPTAS